MTAAVSGRASELGKLCAHYQFQRLDLFGPAASGSDLNLNLVLRPNDSGRNSDRQTRGSSVVVYHSFPRRSERLGVPAEGFLL